MEKNKLFKDKRWNEYQNVEVLKTKVKRTEKDEETAKWFKNFLNNKINKEKDTDNKK